MDRLLNFLYQYRAFFTFLLLEFFCAWLIVENNQYQSSRFFNSSNRLAANLISFSQGVREYFSLRKINAELAEENAELRTQLEKRNQSLYRIEVREISDPLVVNQFDFVSAKVVNNSIYNFKNYITVNKGAAEGIKPGMAVLSSAGAVGKVKAVSGHFAVLISLLNIDEQLSSTIKRTGHFGTIQWDGLDPRIISLRYIPRHADPAVGDSVVTSGFNAIFPPNILVGIITQVSLREEAPFYDLSVELAQDFSKLAFVEIIRSHLRAEKDSLELNIIGEPK